MALKMAMRKTPPQQQQRLPLGVHPTQQNKIVNVAEQLGIPGLKHQQGTTRTIFHFLPLVEGAVAETTYQFFKNVKNSQPPFTNVSDNKLQAGESLNVARIYFAILTLTTATSEVVDLQTFDQFTMPAYYVATWNLKIASQEYTKDNAAAAFKPEFNKNAMHANYNVYHASVGTVIPPDIQFYVIFDAPAMVNPASDTLSFFIGCFIEGDGSLLNVKTNL